MVAMDPDYFTRFANGQNPKILWIGCSDARVPANRIMGLDTGDVFIARNVANQVSHMDTSVMSVLQVRLWGRGHPGALPCPSTRL
jgi:carbonic anhydrase